MATFISFTDPANANVTFVNIERIACATYKKDKDVLELTLVGSWGTDFNVPGDEAQKVMAALRDAS